MFTARSKQRDSHFVREQIKGQSLCLRGNLFKQRVALPGRGKSGSTRTLLATRFAGTLYFLFGFEKKDRDNITQRELGIYQSLASTLVVLSNDQIETALKANELMEVQHEPND